MPTPSFDFYEIKKMLNDIKADLFSEWPIIPHENLEAGKQFLMRVLTFAEEMPNLTANECVVLAIKEFEEPTHPVGLSKVIAMQPNYPVFNWGIFKNALSCNTPLGDFIEKIRAEDLASKVIEITETREVSLEKESLNFLNILIRQTNKPENDVSLPLNMGFNNIKKYGACT